MTWSDQIAVVIDRRRALEGELQLQRRGEEYEIIYNGATECILCGECADACQNGTLKLSFGRVKQEVTRMKQLRTGRIDYA